jgi:hypothetical protein
MVHKLGTKRVLLYQSVGFLAIIALSWFDELTGLRSLLLGDHPYISDFRESAVEMLLVMVVWLFVARSTRRFLGHLKDLEAFMRVCAWCRRVEHQGRWIHLDEFLREGFNTPTSHGICEDCLSKQRSNIETARRARDAAQAQRSHTVA